MKSCPHRASSKSYHTAVSTGQSSEDAAAAAEAAGEDIEIPGGNRQPVNENIDEHDENSDSESNEEPSSSDHDCEN